VSEAGEKVKKKMREEVRDTLLLVGVEAGMLKEGSQAVPGRPSDKGSMKVVTLPW
jgi:hypothetical protein